MKNENTDHVSSFISRRDFLRRSSAAAVGGSLLASLPVASFANSSNDETIKVALVGCGGRGTGAAGQALNTDGPVKLVAMADLYEDTIKTSLANLQGTPEKPGGAAGWSGSVKDKIDVPPDRQFTGFDAYKKAIALADIVILTTPPGFRPMQFEEAVRQGKHVFMEKPVCIDAPGFHKVMNAAQEAKKKNLKVGVGLQRRHQQGYMETIQRLQGGAIGDIVSMRAYWTGNPPWVHARADLEKQYGRKLTEMEYQLRNWYHFLWLCGDHIIEQHVHNLDVINWLKNDHPISARGMGGLDPGKGADYGEIFNHHAVEFTYADGTICHSMSRQQLGCWNDVSEFALGTKGKSQLDRQLISGPSAWHYKGAWKNPYQVEHDDLFDAIRNDKPYNEAEYGAMSAFTGVLGRMATYSGTEIEWDQAVNSKIDTMVKDIDKVSFADAWNLNPPTLPGPDGNYKIPVPGETVVI
ncbi:MAG TPA: Gfo/Idh/MocA family oxidoreductase [Verrucomicrobiae bacterium]